MPTSEELPEDVWVKVVGMLQRNWAVISRDEGGALVLFVSDTSEIFDRMVFGSAGDA